MQRLNVCKFAAGPLGFSSIPSCGTYCCLLLLFSASSFRFFSQLLLHASALGFYSRLLLLASTISPALRFPSPALLSSHCPPHYHGLRSRTGPRANSSR